MSDASDLNTLLLRDCTVLMKVSRAASKWSNADDAYAKVVRSPGEDQLQTHIDLLSAKELLRDALAEWAAHVKDNPYYNPT